MQAGRLIIISGAGLSAESGISTFRQGGLWENHSVEEVCSEATWKKNLEKVHDFYNQRRANLAQTQPNTAHHELAQLENLVHTVHFTQNIDDLMQRAGSQKLIQLHGDLTKMECRNCQNRWEIGYKPWVYNDPCPTCRHPKAVKPYVVFFGGAAPNYRFLWSVLESATALDVLLVIGTSGVVLPISQIAKDFPGMKVLNILESTSDIAEENFHHIFYGPATTQVPLIKPLVFNHLLAKLKNKL